MIGDCVHLHAGIVAGVAGLEGVFAVVGPRENGPPLMAIGHRLRIARKRR
jgi:hypothetical protein